LDEFIQAIEYLAACRLVVAALQKKNHGNHDGELKKRKSHDASYWSREQFDYSHACSSCRLGGFLLSLKVDIRWCVSSHRA
jgi:hypothetical protein